MNKPKIYIDGKEGTTGLQIYERLGGRDDLELLLIDEDKRKDTEERRKFLNAADLVFLCLPDAAAVEAVSLIENGNTKVIDASTAHRTAPGWALRLCGAVQAPPGADLREHAGLEPRLPRHRVHQHCLSPGGHGHPARRHASQLLLPHRLFRRREEDDCPV